MSPQFFRTKPLQTCKLVAIVGVLLSSAGVFFGLVPAQSVTTLLLVPLLALALAVAVAAETLLAGYRAIRAGGPPTDGLAGSRAYGLARAGEVAAVALSASGFAVVVSALPDGSMAGPGAIGLWFLLLGLSLLVLGGSLVRVLTEYYYYYRRGAAP
jgi:hypothetical protein